MNKQKYIPGDVVFHNGEVDNVIGVESNDEHGLFLHDTPYALYENIEPIPITSEILEKNGWKKVSIYPVPKYMKGTTADFAVWYTENGWNMSFEGRAFLWHLKYVHEIQHFFFGLGVDSEMEV